MGLQSGTVGIFSEVGLININSIPESYYDLEISLGYSWDDAANTFVLSSERVSMGGEKHGLDGV